MLCSSCGAECADDLELCSNCGAHLKADITTDTAPTDSAKVSSSLPVSKRPVKLDIAAILGESSLPSPATRSDDDEFVRTFENDVHHVDSSESEAVASVDFSARPASLADVLLLILCLVLGLGILAVVILIIWPNIIPMLFYHG